MSLTAAEQFEENEQYDKAYEEYKKIYVEKPQSVEILERLGHIAIILNKKEDAADYYQKIIKLDPSNVLAYEQLMDIYFHTDRYKYYINRGNLHIVQEEYSHAISDFKKALDKTQNEEEINSTRFVLATLYEQIDKNHQAIDEYLRILDTDSLNDAVFLKLSEVYIKEDSISSAVAILERAIEKGFDSDVIKEKLAQLYLKNNQPEKAREYSKDDLVKVKSLLEEGKNTQAYELLNKLRETYKKNPNYHSIFAQYYFNVSDWEKSLEEVDEFEKFEKNSPLSYQMRALIYESQGKDFESHINWAKYNLARHDKDVALNEYFSAYQINDKDSELVRNIAELLEVNGEKTHAAEFWEKLVEIEPANKKAIEKLADFKESIGDYRSEIEALEKLYALDNKNISAVKKLASTYEKIKNKDKALEFYNKLIAISPVNDDYEKAKAKLQKLENVKMVEEVGLLDKFMALFSKK